MLSLEDIGAMKLNAILQNGTRLKGRVKATLTGKVLDIDFAKALARNPDLTLSEILMLDKVQKKKELTEEEVSYLKEKSLIEGRKPNFHISSVIAERTDQKADYIKNRGLKDQHYKDLILEFIDKYGSASKEDIDKLILDILPNVLHEEQKENKVRNLVYAMSKRDKTIRNEGTQRKPVWMRLSKQEIGLDKLQTEFSQTLDKLLTEVLKKKFLALILAPERKTPCKVLIYKTLQI